MQNAWQNIFTHVSILRYLAAKKLKVHNFLRRFLKKYVFLGDILRVIKPKSA